CIFGNGIQSFPGGKYRIFSCKKLFNSAALVAVQILAFGIYCGSDLLVDDWVFQPQIFSSVFVIQGYGSPIIHTSLEIVSGNIITKNPLRDFIVFKKRCAGK